MRRARGAALVLVLWLIVLATALIGAFALSARMEGLQGRVLSEGVGAYETARAGIEYALVRVADADPQSHWRPDATAHAWRYRGSELQVTVVDESGKVDVNLADARLLGQLARAVGIEAAQADALGSAIVDWRDADPLTQPLGGAEDPEYAAAGLPYGAKDAPFESVAEVQHVLGMSAAAFDRLQPYLTLYGGRPEPDAQYAPGPVLAALGLAPEPILARRLRPDATLAPEQAVSSGSGTYSIESRARLENGRVAVLRAVVRSGSGPVPGSMYTALRWEETWAPR